MVNGLSIRKNDTVLVIAGKEKGKRGKVLFVVPARSRVIVEHVNMIKRHTRPNPQRGVKGGILEREAPVQVANLKVICPECGEPSRIGRKRLDDGRGVRVCKHCHATFN